MAGKGSFPAIRCRYGKTDGVPFGLVFWVPPCVDTYLHVFLGAWIVDVSKQGYMLDLVQREGCFFSGLPTDR